MKEFKRFVPPLRRIYGSAVFFIIIAFFILTLALYRILRLNFFIRGLKTDPSTSSESVFPVKITEQMGLKAQNVFKDQKDLVVFYRPFGLSRSNVSHALAGDDLAYIATEIPAHPKSPRGELLRRVFEKLLEGPSSDEQREGLYSLIPPKARLLKLKLSDDGCLTLNFNKKFSPGGGSLAMFQARLAVEETARQFPEVKEVKILVEGQQFTFEP